MIYLKGSKADCDAYDQYVTAEENYSGTTVKWADTIEHKNGIDFAIIKHPNYNPDPSLNLIEIPNLEGWFIE